MLLTVDPGMDGLQNRPVMADTTIRAVRPDDEAAFVRAYELAWDAALAPILGTRLGDLASLDTRTESFRRGIEQVSPDVRIWVAEGGGTIVGLAVCTRTGSTCELRSLYVVPQAWGSGLAHDLMETALDAMRDRGAHEAVLWVVEANARARRFYEREGWSADGEARPSDVGPQELRYRRAL
jgi:GNAT superfamily N-acetyltransferase